MAGRILEWPPGSGWRAFYTPHEEKLLRDIYDAAVAGRIPVATARREWNVIHGLKAVLDASMVAE